MCIDFVVHNLTLFIGPSRRHPQNDNLAFSMDYSTDMSGFGDQGRQSANATPGPSMARPPSQSAFGSQNPYGGFNAPMDQSFGVQSYGVPPPQQQQQFNTFVPGGPQQPGPQAGNPYANSFGGPQQQFLMAAGEQLLSNPMTKAAIDAYSQSLVDRSKTWIGGVSAWIIAKCFTITDFNFFFVSPRPGQMLLCRRHKLCDKEAYVDFFAVST